MLTGTSWHDTSKIPIVFGNSIQDMGAYICSHHWKKAFSKCLKN
jgi:hypothetical protein